MARLFCIRAASALVLCSLGFLLVSLDPFLSAAPVRQGISADDPSVTVNRFRKGDRLPVHPAGVTRREPRELDGLQTQQKVPPVGCDPAFSPVTSPALSGVYGRCMT